MVQGVGQFHLSDVLTVIKTSLYTTKINFFYSYTFHNRYPGVLLKFKKRVLSVGISLLLSETILIIPEDILCNFVCDVVEYTRCSSLV
jgi:hypothetical protein